MTKNICSLRNYDLKLDENNVIDQNQDIEIK